MRIPVLLTCSVSLASCNASPSQRSEPTPSPTPTPTPTTEPIRAEQATAFRSGWDAKAPARPGTIFGGLALGGPPDGVRQLYATMRESFSKEYVAPDDSTPRFLAMLRASRVVISAKAEGGAITDLGLWTNDERDVGCPPDLAPAMRAAWQAAPHATYEDADVWLDPPQRARARLRTGTQCRLEFERYEPAETWVDAVVHPELVGKQASALAALGVPEASWKAGTGDVTWSAFGCGFGGGIAGVTAELENGVIVALRGSTYAGDKGTVDAVLAAIVARRGQPREVSGLSVRRLEWTGAPPLRLDEDNGRIEVEAGRLRP